MRVKITLAKVAQSRSLVMIGLKKTGFTNISLVS